MTIAIEGALGAKGAAAAVPLVKAAAGAGAAGVGLPVIAAVAVVAGVIYATRDSNKPQTELDILEAKLKERDLYVINHLKENDCKDVLDLESLKKLVEEVFARNPEEKIFHEGLHEKCIETAKKSKKTDWLALGGKGIAGVGVLAGAKKAMEEVVKFPEDQRRKTEEQDRYVLDQLERGNCGKIVSPKQYEQLVAQTFRRNPAQAVWLEGQYLKCLDEARMQWSLNPLYGQI